MTAVLPLRAERARALERYGVAATATVFLVVCRDLARCAVAVAIEALAALAPPAHLIVVCHTRDADRIRAKARKLAVADRVTVVDSHGDMRAYYGVADVFVSPSIYEPSPDFVLEAMACELPVIGSTKSGVAELLAEHDCGFAFESSDAAALAAHMRSLHESALRARLGENARRAVLPLSPAAMTLALVLLYRDLLAATVPGTAPRTAMSGG